jgi:nucleoside-diphosphate-sugar epimerase
MERPELVPGDLCDPAALAAAVDGVTQVLHVAGVVRALSAAGFDAGNRLGTANLVRALRARGGAPPRFVHVSSIAAARPSADGKGTDRPPPECAPVSAYGRSKLAAELEVASAGGGLRWIVLRPPAVYGPGDRDFLPLFRAARRGLVALPGRDRPFSFVHVDDLVDAIVTALDAQTSALFVPITGSPPLTPPRIVELLARAVGNRVRMVRLPLFAARVAGAGADLVARLRGKPATFSRDKVRELAAAGWVADPEPARVALSWTAARDHESGFAGTAEWYRSQGLLRAPR